MRTVVPDTSSSTLATALRMFSESCDRLKGFQDIEVESQLKADPSSVLFGAEIHTVTDEKVFESLLTTLPALVKVHNLLTFRACWVYVESNVGGTLQVYTSFPIRYPWAQKQPWEPMGLLFTQLAGLVRQVTPYNVVTLPV